MPFVLRVGAYRRPAVTLIAGGDGLRAVVVGGQLVCVLSRVAAGIDVDGDLSQPRLCVIQGVPDLLSDPMARRRVQVLVHGDMQLGLEFVP